MPTRLPPTLDLERAAGAPTGTLVLGVDEVGRGPLAGPVVAGAAWLDIAGLPEPALGSLGDSKVLSASARHRALEAVAPHAMIALGQASVREIDRLNILNAALLAMKRAVARLLDRLGREPDLILVDGNRSPDWRYPTRTVVRGDSLSASIAVAAIAAKQARDAEMARLAKAHPGFGWERNAGYGTAEHRAALTRLGPCKHHRMSFAPMRLTANEETSPGS